VFIAILIAVVRIRFVAHRVTRNPPEITLPLLLTLLGIVEILVVFAVIYHGRPNALSGPPGATQTFQTALYFSVITWTTVGYGDWTPNSSIQLFVSVQALLGYIFMGVIVGLLSAAIHSLGARNADF
jgi:protein-S-isoprenylcysteine O-methyltransferase Ste14